MQLRAMNFSPLRKENPGHFKPNILFEMSWVFFLKKKDSTKVKTLKMVIIIMMAVKSKH